MTMSFLLQDQFDATERYSPAVRTTAATPSKGERDTVHILSEKLEIPNYAGLVERPRLIHKLERSLGHFAATLVSGRAGTGKTSIAAAYARTRKSAAWFTVESSDIDWNVFASYLAASVHRAVGSKKTAVDLLPAITNSSPAAMSRDRRFTASSDRYYFGADRSTLRLVICLIADSFDCAECVSMVPFRRHVAEHVAEEVLWNP